MFARILDFEIKPEKKEEFVKVVKNEVLPILRKQNGFLEFLPFIPEKLREEKIITISLWTSKNYAEKYEKEFYFKVQDILKPFLKSPILVKFFEVEPTFAELIEKKLAA